MLWRPSYHRRIVQLGDFVTTAASFVMSYLIWNWFRIMTNIGLPIQVEREDIWKIIIFSSIWVFVFNEQKAYSYLRFTSLQKEIQIVAKTTIIGVLIFFASFFFFRFKYTPRSYIVVFAIISFFMLCMEKILLFHVAKIIRRKGKNTKKILIIGTGQKAKEFVITVKDNMDWGLDIIGHLAADKSRVGTSVYGHEIIGCYSDIEDILHAHHIDEVIICASTKNFNQIQGILDCCEREGVQLRIYSDFIGKIVKKVRLDQIHGLQIISFLSTPDNEFQLYLKRLMDILISGILLVVLFPLFSIIALAIKLTSKGPLFYQWNVVGLNKQPFKSWKFRTMVPNADELKEKLIDQNEMKGPVFKIKDDPRITKIGIFLRKFSLDELPQLWSVLKGDMSIVGPRPAGPNELNRYESWHRRKLSIKPGITCLWQVSGRNMIKNFDDWVKLDLQYIENWSLGLDLKILIKTIPAIFKGTGQ